MKAEDHWGKRGGSSALLEKFSRIDIGLPDADTPEQALAVTERDSSGAGLGWVEPSKWPGEVIGKLATSRVYVPQETSVYSLAEGLEKNPGIVGVAVVDKERTCPRRRVGRAICVRA